MAELSLELSKLEAVPSALDMIRFLDSQPNKAASPEDIMAGLSISERRFQKALRRLVTTYYMQMRSDYRYELTQQGRAAAQELAAYDAAGPTKATSNNRRLQRQILLAVPRHFVAGQTAQIHLGFPADPNRRFNPSVDAVLRVTTIHAHINSTSDEIFKLDNDVRRQTFEITPEFYDQVRIRIQVFQLSPYGDDITNCGGMYVDVNVATGGQAGSLVAYGTTVEFDPA